MKKDLKCRDCLWIMGLGANVTDDDIKRRYRKLAKHYHPDLNKNIGDEKFIELKAAYESLLNTSPCSHNNLVNDKNQHILNAPISGYLPGQIKKTWWRAFLLRNKFNMYEYFTFLGLVIVAVILFLIFFYTAFNYQIIITDKQGKTLTEHSLATVIFSHLLNRADVTLNVKNADQINIILQNMYQSDFNVPIVIKGDYHLIQLTAILSLVWGLLTSGIITWLSIRKIYLTTRLYLNKI